MEAYVPQAVYAAVVERGGPGHDTARDLLAEFPWQPCAVAEGGDPAEVANAALAAMFRDVEDAVTALVPDGARCVKDETGFIPEGRVQLQRGANCLGYAIGRVTVLADPPSGWDEVGRRLSPLLGSYGRRVPLRQLLHYITLLPCDQTGLALVLSHVQRLICAHPAPTDVGVRALTARGPDGVVYSSSRSPLPPTIKLVKADDLSNLQEQLDQLARSDAILCLRRSATDGGGVPHWCGCTAVAGGGVH